MSSSSVTSPPASQHLSQELASLVASASIPLGAVDSNFRVTFFNRAFAQLDWLSITPQVGRTIAELIPDTAEHLMSVVAEVLASGRSTAVQAGFAGQLTHQVNLFRFSVGEGSPRVAIVPVPLTALAEDPNANWRKRFGFETLLSSVAGRLLSVTEETFDDAMSTCLREICEAQGFPYGAVIHMERATGKVREIHAWRDSGLHDFHPATPPEVTYELSEFFNSARRRDLVYRPTHEISDKYTHFREALAEHDMSSVIYFPAFMTDQIAGAISFTTRGVPAPPSADLERRLRTLVDVLSQAVMRNERDRELRRAYNEVSRLKASLEDERDYLREEIVREIGGAKIIFVSPAIKDVLGLVEAVSRTNATVLVRGESGVGKELVVRALHAASDRREKPLVKVNCASIPRELFESEFFGHKRGAFTGALRDRVGRFELANGGTLFLDEVGEIPLAEQAKLLRVIQEGEFEPVGDDRTRRVDIRLVAATNRRLERDVANGLFRRDLYFRLNVFPIDVPPLRDRREDIVPLAEHFMRYYAPHVGRHGAALSAEDQHQLTSYEWPGNVRELAHVIERSLILSANRSFRVVLPDAPPPASVPPPPPFPVAPATGSFGVVGASQPVATPPSTSRSVATMADLKAMEIEVIENALAASQGRVAGKDGAAERLGLSPSTLRDRMKSLGLRPKR